MKVIASSASYLGTLGIVIGTVSLIVRQLLHLTPVLEDHKVSRALFCMTLALVHSLVLYRYVTTCWDYRYSGSRQRSRATCLSGDFTVRLLNADGRVTAGPRGGPRGGHHISPQSEMWSTAWDPAETVRTWSPFFTVLTSPVAVPFDQVALSENTPTVF